MALWPNVTRHTKREKVMNNRYSSKDLPTIRSALLRSTMLAVCLVAPALGAANAAKYVEFDASGGVNTQPQSMSNGVITGFYQSTVYPYYNHGFVRAADGTITEFDVQGALETDPHSINISGSITGYYLEGSSVHGFLRATDGTITSFDAPDGVYGTEAWSINKGGVIAGNYNGSDNHNHGFVRDAKGTITEFDPTNSVATLPLSINNGGTITGPYFGSGVYHGFVRTADGTITEFDPTGSTGTLPYSINGAGTIAGAWADSSNNTHGFVRAADGTITSFDLTQGTIERVDPIMIGNKGQITGTYWDPNLNRDRGFLRSASGTVKTFDAPGSGTTHPYSIDGGAITGWYFDSQVNQHGFLRTP